MKRKSVIFIIAALAVIILFSTILSAQISKVPDPRKIPGTVTNKRPIEYDKGKYGGVFHDSIVSEPKTFCDAVSADAGSGTFIAFMSPSLLDLNYDTGEWEVFIGNKKKGKTGKGYDMDILDDSSMIMTFYLRKDIYWIDGTRMTADDWVWYYNEVIGDDDIGHPGNPSTYVEMPDGDEIQIIAEKIDRWTFKLIFPRTAGEPENSSSYNVMPKHIVKPIKDSQGADGVIEMWGVDTPVSELIGFGPWIIDSYNIGEGVALKRNERYFEKDKWNNRLPYLDKYYIGIVSDINNATLKFQNKELDTVFVQTVDFKTLVEGSSAGGYSLWNGGPENSMRFIVFNQDPNAERMKGNPKLEWFEDKRWRHAVSLLIDRESIILQAYQSLAQVDHALLSSASRYYDPNISFKSEFNPAKAMKLLEEMGIRDRDGNGIMEDKNGNEIKFELMTNLGYEYKSKTVTLVAKEWTSFGLKCTDILLEFNVVTDKSNSGEWDAQFVTLTSDIYPEADNVWLSDGNMHMWHPHQDEPYRDWEAEINTIHTAAKYEPDYETRQALWNEMYTILYDELPFIPMVRKLDFKAFYDKWGNIYWDTYEGIYGGDFGGDFTQRLFLDQ